MSELPNRQARSVSEGRGSQGGQPVPVFNCVVHVARAAADGTVVARVTNLAGIEGRGRTEREALAQAVAAFKAAVSHYHASGEPIPWLPVTEATSAGELQRLIAVHL
jgi:predicted RNase H-like HicB family nuclease